MPSRIRRQNLSLAQAVALGALHGPAELFPVSSSAHVTLIPWLLRWDYPQLDPELRKRFEVALHAGAAVALACSLRRGPAPARRRGRLLRLTLASAPPAAVGYAYKAQISQRLGTPRSSALGLIAGGLAMLAAERAPARRPGQDAGALDAVWLGLAQACALFPGVSRSGATRVAARLRGFGHRDAAVLSQEVAAPVILGAAGLEAVQSLRRGVDRTAARALAAGGGAALVSGLLSLWLLGRLNDRVSLRGFAVYRIALGSLVLALRPGSRAHRCPDARA